ncbi:GlxA family transcriptional regulator [Pseudobacter ginsenosidimutans]|uniref:AraC family transcriptional regulator with amidase-like domain n=1 Tax=Pseudobacter ginsenosidimutans TaxID=661488 RepID=A0A4Q7N2N7_9BACT|nr:helix-turn-helix domain-containing protein [Pseudobacter ginsenosidimutans]QEC42984.1 helix-turn-helix domain-containing protein [Pseudobacter ginsenosidimutans]RZS74335.1 AraC family transcriptional regulator with amidase-like domain [Pseudobacter ginsenosidimutans]
MQVTVFAPEKGVIEAVTPPYRAFKAANDFLGALGKKPIFEVEYAGLTNLVSANDGEYTIKTDRLISDVNKTDLLIIPPVYGDIEDGIKINSDVIPYIQKLYRNGCSIASLCLGAFLLAETGLLNGKKCSTHWAYLDEFKVRYPQIDVVDGAIITEVGNIYSSGGASSLWNLILYLIEKFSDRETAILISKNFALDIGRNSQAPFTIFKGQKKHADDEIMKVQEYIEKNYNDKITIDELAAIVNSGRRTFERRFRQATNNTPLEYIQRVRMEAAKRSFEASRKNVSEVMLDVGYTDTKTFRDTFRKVTGLTPIEYRNKFAKVAVEM